MCTDASVTSFFEDSMYKNYIFDFYGTLVDIHTEEEHSSLWRQMAELYSVYGAEYTPAQLRQAYLDACQQAEKVLKEETGYEYPEIDLQKVFVTLLETAPGYHPTKKILDVEAWSYDIANTFRVLSRKRFHTYPHTIETLKKLKEAGCHVCILSNAQKCFTMPEMEQSGVLPYIDSVYLSSEYQMRKPQKEFLAELIEKEHLLKNESIMIGNDCFSDVAIAVKNQMHSIYLDTGSHTKRQNQKMIEQVCRGRKKWMPVTIEGDIRKILSV